MDSSFAEKRSDLDFDARNAGQAGCATPTECVHRADYMSIEEPKIDEEHATLQEFVSFCPSSTKIVDVCASTPEPEPVDRRESSRSPASWQTSPSGEERFPCAFTRMFGLPIVNNALFSPENWLARFNAEGSDPLVAAQLRKEIAAGTIRACCDGELPNEEGSAIFKDLLKLPAIDRLYDNTDHIDPKCFPCQEKTFIRIYNEDCIDLGLHFKKKGYNPVVLNMASATHPGGHYLGGSAAQEETLFRRTNYYRHLDYNCSDIERDVMGENAKTDKICEVPIMYPIPKTGGIYSRDVVVFRENAKKGYAWMSKPELLSFVAVAACNRPKVADDRLKDQFVDITREKITTIFKIALNEKHDCVILGAFGCGAYRNPPRHIAELFHEVIRDQFSDKFKVIAFAIINDVNSFRSHNPKGNIQPFEDVFRVKATKCIQ